MGFGFGFGLGLGLRLGLVLPNPTQASRVALLQNIKALPFTNERLAASVGKSAAEFDAAPLTDAAANVVFDALAQSKNGLVLPLPLPLPLSKNGLVLPLPYPYP